MPKRICASCGKEKDLQGRKICDSSHFIWKECVWSALALDGPGERKPYPLCKKPLR